jgi:hypothetical protein
MPKYKKPHVNKVQISIYLEIFEVNKFRVLAEKENRTISQMVRILAQEGLAAHYLKQQRPV